jgi:hypothetical protein
MFGAQAAECGAEVAQELLEAPQSECGRSEVAHVFIPEPAQIAGTGHHQVQIDGFQRTPTLPQRFDMRRGGFGIL